MRTITMLLTAALLVCAGCRDGNAPQDAGTAPLCAPGAEGLRTLRCDYGVDTSCRSSFGYDCRCACTGYWECDQVKIVCDPDAGVPRD